MAGLANCSILRRSSLRGMARQPWQTGLTLLGIALGVAIVVAVDLANSSARRAFALSLEALSGVASHQLVGGPLGIEDGVFARLRIELGLRRSAPLVTGRVVAAERSFALLGVDALSERDLGRHFAALQRTVDTTRGGLWQQAAVALHRQGAGALGVSAGDTLVARVNGRQRTLRVAAVIDGGDARALSGVMFSDIATAQEVLGRSGWIDRIDLLLDDTEAQRLRAWLPPGLRLLESERRNASLQQMSEAFHLNLTAMSLLALLVAGLLIHNTVSFSVLRARRTLGTLRALGVSRYELVRLVAGEAALLGICGSLCGVLIGLLLGQGLVQLVTRTINDLYFQLHVTTLLIDPGSLVKGFLLGCVVTALAAAWPLREVALSTPISAQQRSVLEQRWYWRLPLLALLGLALLGVGGAVLIDPHGSLERGFVGLVMQVFGYCLLVPALMWVLVRVVLGLLPRRSSPGIRLALRGIETGISRTGLAVAALTVAVSVTVGVGIMVDSFRESVARWLHASLSGDVYVASSTPHQHPLPAELQRQLLAVPSLAAASRSRRVRVETGLGPLTLMARDVLPVEQADFQLLAEVDAPGVDAPEVESPGVASPWPRFRAGQGLFISEPLAWRHGLKPGDSLTLHTAQGRKEVPVLGVFTDYSSSRGVLLLALPFYQQWWQDPTVSGLVMRAGPGGDGERLLASVKALLSAQHGDFRAVSNRMIRDQSLVVFDRTFAITRVLRLLAVVVAFVGVLSAIMALQLERQREYAVLRATGMTPWQLGQLMLLQTGVLGLLAGVLALPLGLLMSDVLIDVINRRSFGWTMARLVPPGVLWEALLLAVTAAMLAGCYPAWRAGRVPLSAALREE